MFNYILFSNENILNLKRNTKKKKEKNEKTAILCIIISQNTKQAVSNPQELLFDGLLLCCFSFVFFAFCFVLFVLRQSFSIQLWLAFQPPECQDFKSVPHFQPFIHNKIEAVISDGGKISFCAPDLFRSCFQGKKWNIDLCSFRPFCQVHQLAY